jgi:hypothetical protein
MLRIDQDEIAGPSGEGVAQVVENAASPAVAVGTVSASRAGSSAIIAALAGEFGLGEVIERQRCGVA